MEETQAVSSPAIEVDRGALVTLTPEQRTEFRKTGELPKPESPKVEESASSTEESQEESVPRGTSETEETPTQQKKPQETRRKPDAEARIKQLTDRQKQLERELEEARKSKESPKTEEKTPPQRPQNYQDWRKTFKAAPWVEQYAKDNPDAQYEDAQAAMSDYLDEVREGFRNAERQQQNQQKEFSSKVSEAKQRYGDKFEEILMPTVNSIIGDQAISGAVKSMLNESEVLPDLLFTLGSNEAELKDFMQMAKENPGKALRYIALTESLIREELSGAPAKESPVKPVTQAPKPPAEIGGRAAAPGDALAAAAQANDFRSFKAEATRRQLAKLKG